MVQGIFSVSKRGSVFLKETMVERWTLIVPDLIYAMEEIFFFFGELGTEEAG